MHLRFPWWTAAALVLAAACGSDAGRTTLPVPPAPKAPALPLGVYDVTITGIGTGEMRATAKPVQAARPDGPAGVLTVAPTSLVLEQASSGSFTEGSRTAGGQRYLWINLRVRNASGTPLNNLVFLASSTATTIAGTPIVSIKRFDGADADPAIASQIAPTGAVALRADGANMQSLYPDVLQVLTEAEAASFTPPAGVTNVFPYGYVVRNAVSNVPSRSLPSTSQPNQFDGVLTIALRLPLQASAASDVFSVSVRLMAVEDSESRVTESIEEGQDTSAVRRLREYAAALGATTVTVLNGSPAAGADVADYPGQRQLCSVRTAGTSASPARFITTPAAYTRVGILRPGESSSACGANFRSGTPTAPTLNSPYAVTLKALDRYGNVITGAVDTMTVSQASGPAATFGAPAALVSGQAAINVTYTANGTSVLNATGRRNRSQRSVEVATAATAVLSAGDNQAAMAGSAVPVKPAVLVRDLGGNPLSGVPVTFSVASGGGYVTGGTATTNASGIATVGSWVLGSPATLNTLTATAAGAATPVTFKASGCSGGGGTGYGITLCYISTMTSAQRVAFDSAAAKWGRVITGDLADISASIAGGTCGANSPSFNLTIDDLLIFATVEPIDGPGAFLGFANWCYYRTTGGLPLVGTMRFDSADMPSMESGGLLPGVIQHEMGHVLGIGTRWTAFGLLQNPSPVGGPPLDTYYSGSNGITGFNNIGGSTYTGGNKVPVENQYASGTINVHWREAVLQNELMTGFVNAGSMPLSQLTVRSLADMGYTVNVANADPFFLTLSLRDGPAPGAIPLGNDILDLPQYSIDEQGRTVRVR
ncbi:MAG TPA: leishmanolysin-related zinc metalloendopeptidase [Longimicrobium sp.]|nr:leishmanolysin-related zinc metalloendopeptidase [Longimicrobium sp.]